jgi:DNA-binding transcriptional ArsR family regulator
MPCMSVETAVREKVPHPSVDALDLATILRTVGDPLRLEIVGMLADGRERSCTEVLQALDLPASTASYHLKLLREAGITHTRPEGTQRMLSLRRADLEQRFPGLVDLLTR